MTGDAKRLIELVLIRLSADLESASRSQQLSLQDTREAGSAMTSRYDTFREEAEYRTTGYGLQMLQIRDAIGKIKSLLVVDPATGQRVISGSLVTIKTQRDQKTYLILPSGGGMELCLEDRVVHTINLQAPLARSIFNSQEGDEVELTKGSGRESGVVVEVS